MSRRLLQLGWPLLLLLLAVLQACFQVCWGGEFELV